MCRAVPLAILRYFACKAISLKCFETQRSGTINGAIGSSIVIGWSQPISRTLLASPACFLMDDGARQQARLSC